MFRMIVSQAVLAAAMLSPGLTQSEAVLHRFEFKSAHMGTLFHLSLYAPEVETAEAAAEAAFRRIAQLEALMSDYRADSELNLLRKEPVGQPIPISSDLFRVFKRSLEVAELSGGAMDPTVGPYVRLWRFSRKRHQLPAAQDLAKAKLSVGWRLMELDPANNTVILRAPAMQLDLGGIAKGFAADEALALLRSRGIRSALLAASGDIAVSEPPPGQDAWRVMVAAPSGSTNTVAPLRLRNAAVSTSGAAEQFVEVEGVKYSHIVNPYTGLGLTNQIQVTVVGPNATATDGFATAVSVLGKERGLAVVERVTGMGALIFVDDGRGMREYLSKRFTTLIR